MPTFQVQRYSRILERMIAAVTVRAGLSDMNDSAAVKRILAAVARELDDSNFQLVNLRQLFNIDTAVGEDLDARAQEIAPGFVTRLPARKAVGLLRFSRTGTTGTVTIPAGTAARTSDNTVVATTIQGTIATGSSVSDDIAALASAAGEEGNISADTAIAFISRPSGVDEVTNPVPFIGGRTEESDEDFRTRIKLYIASLPRGTPRALLFAALGVIDEDSGKQVDFAHVFEDPEVLGKVIVYIDDGAGTAESTDTVSSEVVIASAIGGEEFLSLDHFPVKVESLVTITSDIRGVLTEDVDYILNPPDGQLFFSPPLAATEEITADYTYFTGLIAAVQKVIDGDGTIDFPGYRAAGTQVRVLTPEVIEITVEAVLVLADGADREDVEADVRNAIATYINTLGISGDVIVSEIVCAAMDVDGVMDISVSVPSANVTILDDQIARITTDDIDLG